ncbi:MAG: capsular polysaccharide synthesis protein [Lachnospiraceae bacterium]|nr:capsular polysaccharide synthesis protein [Lachnospiraceae bacterium]
MNNINDLLDKVLSSLNEDDYDSVVLSLQRFLEECPDQIDLRAKNEFLLVKKILELKSSLSEWDQFRLLKNVYDYCKLQYDKDELIRNSPSDATLLSRRNTIWWCWLQGLDAAPEIVRACYRSLSRLGREICVITKDNLKDYVELPSPIMDKWRDGRISNTHFSDLLRLELLCSHGGTWVDATVFCSGTEVISPLLDDASLFCFRSVMRNGVSEYTGYDSWFLHSTKRSGILSDTRDMLYAYWKEEEELMHYFLFHLFFTLATWRHPDECASIPIFSTEPCHVMQMELQRPCSEKRWAQLNRMSDIHKLTYKYDDKIPMRGTTLERVLNDCTIV